MVLLQSCEQVPKRRHSLMSGGYTPESGRVSRRGASARLLDSPLPTLASGLAWHRVEASAAGTVSGFLGAHAAGLIPADAGVGGAAGQLGVCEDNESRPGLRLSVPPAPAHAGTWVSPSPMLQSSSSEPSPQSSNMLQRREEERQRWFRHRNSFLSLQWEVWVVGGSGGERGFRSWYLPPCPRFPQEPPGSVTGRGAPSLALKPQGKLVKLFRFPVSASMPSPGVSLLPSWAPRLPAVDPPLSLNRPTRYSSHLGHRHRLCSIPTPGAPQSPPHWPPAHHSPPHPSHPRSCPCRRTGARSIGRRGRSCNGRAGLEDTQTWLQRGREDRVRISLRGPPTPLRASRQRESPAPSGAPPHPAPFERGSHPGASPHSSGFSSELSPQSSSPSHFHASGLHRVLLHWNSSRGQVRTGRQREQRVENEL